MFERVYIKDGASELRCSPRTFRKWCVIYDVGLLKDVGSSKYYVLRNEFEHAKNREAIGYLLSKHGKQELPSILSAQMKLWAEIKSATKIESRDSSSAPISAYKPSGHHESEFLARLRKIKHEL